MFDPFQLGSQTSPAYVKKLLSLGDFTTAVMARTVYSPVGNKISVFDLEKLIVWAAVCCSASDGMDINFKFSNLVGSVYRNGNVVFSPDGYSVYSPVGNKISVFDLKNNISHTICVESRHNIVALAISPKGTHLVATNEMGDVHYVNLSTETVIFNFHAGRKVKALRFSPDAKHVAVCRDNDIQIFEISKFSQNSYYPFYVRATYHIANDNLTSVDWSHDGNLIVCGGEDKQLRVVAGRKFKNLLIHSLGSHKGPIICAQFLHNSYDIVSVDSRGFCQLWQCSLMNEDLIEGDYEKYVEGEEKARVYFDKTKSFSVIESAGSSKVSVTVTSCSLHAKSNILITAFSNGVFVLHELPSFSLIHNLRVSELQVNTAVFNTAGDWIALGCGKGSAAQLVVWEWQSETYVLKQQAHSQRVNTAEFSPDGSMLATGAEDGKVKIWNSRNAFCTVTFDEHTSSVTAVCWTQSGKAILSASLDGTVRAHDLKRYRNFRTLVCPEPTQLAELAVDSRGDIVCATGKEVYNIFIWSLENGRLLDILAAHQSNISSISIHGNRLASCSWDRTLRIWNIVDSTGESTDLAQQALSVSFSPCGQLVAVLTMGSVFSFFRVDDMTPVGSIEAHLDLDAGRFESDQITKENSGKNKSFTQMAFSPDINFLLLGGDSNSFCLYSVPNKILVKKFTITENRSFDGVVLDINRRNFSEFGNMKLVDDSDSEEDENHRRQIRLPGSKHMDLGERRAKPEIAVTHVSFCPTGRKFGVCSTEGGALYSLDTVGMFDPFQLDSQTSPVYIKKLHPALMASLRLNDSDLIQRVMERTPLESVQLVATAIPLPYAEKLLKWIADGNVVWNSPHIHFYMVWIRAVLHVKGLHLKGRTDVALLTGIQQIIAHHNQLI